MMNAELKGYNYQHWGHRLSRIIAGKGRGAQTISYQGNVNEKEITRGGIT